MNLLIPAKAKVTSKTKRWYSFSLKTFLVVMTVFTIWLGFYMKSFRDRRTAVAAIEQLDGAMGITYFGPEWLRKLADDDRYFWDPAGVHFNRPLSVAELEGVMPYLMSFQRLQHLTLPGDSISDETLHLLLPLAGTLTHLDLSSSPMSDAALVHLKRFANLETLSLLNANLTSAGLAELQPALPGCRIATNVDSGTSTTAP